MSDLVADLDKVKKDVRSLLISAPNGLTLKMLEKDYSAVIGCHLPYEKFGFNNSVDFLRSLSDILRVSSRNGQIIFYGIADKSTEHILSMVRKQKKTKLYNSITSSQQAAPVKKKLSSTVGYPSAFTRSGVLNVLREYPDGFSITKLHEYYEEINGAKLDLRSTADLPAFVMSMSDIAMLDYGKREKSGNNLYVFPSKSLFGYQKSFEKNIHGLPPRLKLSSKFHKEQTPVTTASNKSSSVQSWVNSVSSRNVVTTTAACTSTTTSTYSKPNFLSQILHKNKEQDETKPCTSNSVLQKLNGRRPMHKLSSTTSSGIMSQISSSEKSETCSETEKSAKAVDSIKTEVDNDDFDASLVFDDATPSASGLLQQEIVNLLKDCKTEVRSIKMASLYKKKYGKELCLHKHGYYSIIELIATMTDQISMCRLTRTGEWLIKLRNVKSEKSSDSSKLKSADKAAKKATLEREFKELLTKFKGGIAVDSLEDLYEMHFERSLPLKELSVNSAPELVCKIVDTLNLNGDHLCLQPASACDSLTKTDNVSHAPPIDAIGFGIRYNPAILPSADWGFFDCFVTYVNTPSDFRIQIIGSDTTEAFNLLMDEVERTYCHPNAKIYRIPPHLIVPGQICVAIYHGDNNWNRAVIEELPSGGFVKVRYVDYGDIASVSTAAIYYLKQKFHELPILEVHASLANLRPARANRWDVAARKQLLDFSKNQPLVARVAGEEERGERRVFCLELCDVSTGDDVYINDVLLQKRLAILPNDDDLEPEEIQHIIDNLPGTNPKNDIPSDSPPPYQATESIPPLVNFSELTNPAPSVSVLPVMPPLKVTQPPPGFGSAAPRKELNFTDIDKLIKSLSVKEPKELPSDAVKSKMNSKNTSVLSRQQTKFLKPFRLTDNLKIHVINYKSTALLLSGEISRIFRPDSSDMLAPLLMIKGIQEHFTELVLANNQENAKLFADFEKFKVKAACKSDGIVRQVVTLHRLCDVPEMITELEPDDGEALISRLNEIIAVFDPDNGYWFRGVNDCLGSKSDENFDKISVSTGLSLGSVNPSFSSSTRTPSTTSADGKSTIKNSASGSVASDDGQLNQLYQKKEQLLQELRSSNNPSSRLFNELRKIMEEIKNLDGETIDVLASGEGTHITPDVSFDVCAIPADENAHIEGFFSEVRDSCDDLLELSSQDDGNIPNITSATSSNESPVFVASKYISVSHITSAVSSSAPTSASCSSSSVTFFSSSVCSTSTLPSNQNTASVMYHYASPNAYMYSGSPAYPVQQYTPQQQFLGPPSLFSASNQPVGWPAMSISQPLTVVYSTSHQMEVSGGIYPYYR